MSTKSPAMKIIERAFKEDVDGAELLNAYTQHCAAQSRELARLNGLLRQMAHSGEYNAGFAKGQDIQATAVKDLRDECEILRKSLALVRGASSLTQAIGVANAALLTDAQAIKIGRGILHE